MLTLAVAFLIATLVAAVSTPIVARLAFRYGLLDHPSSARKVHTRPIPRIGGLAVGAAFFAPILGLAIHMNPVSDIIYRDATAVAALCAGAAVILILGIYDDAKDASVKLRFGVQLIVAVAMWFCGFRIELFGDTLGVLPLHVLSPVLTVLWIVGIINALNLIDGLDGLAAGVSLFACLVLFGVSLYDGAILACVLTASLAGALLGFLFFNFNPAKIFLGGSGSMLLGFLLSTMSIWTQRKGATAAAILVPVVALGVPILDTTLAMVRRILRRQSPFAADREHLHHRLLALGLSHRGAVYTLYTMSAVFAIGALALLDVDATRQTIVLGSVAALAVVLTLKVGIVRAPWMRRRPAKTASALREEARKVARQIRVAPDVETAWQELVTIVPKLGCEEVRLSWAGFGEWAESSNWDRRITIQHWRADQDTGVGGPWQLDRPHSKQHVVSLSLSEDGRSFGELLLLRDQKLATKREARARELVFEILLDGLIDFALARAELRASRRIVRLSERTGSGRMRNGSNVGRS